MEFSSVAPRVDPAAQSNNVAFRQPAEALSVKPEIARPVVAADQASDATAAHRSFEPLDTYEVGDNDHVPVPPEPPRKATVLAVIADAPEVETPEEAPEPTEPLPELLRAIDDGPANPTVDVRS